MTRRAVAIVFFLAAPGFVACGRSDLLYRVYDVGVDASTDAHHDADAAPKPDATPDAPPPPIGDYGYVILREYAGGGSIGSEATAVFYESFPLACALSVLPGTCVVATCPSSDHGIGFSAGDIAIAGPNGSGTLHPKQTAQDGIHYDVWQSQASAFVPGDSIKVTAAGATVPAFTAQVTFPGNVSLITPPLGGSPLVVDTTQPLAVSWAQTSAPEILFYAVQDTGTLPSPVLVCYFESRLASAVVPAATLAQYKSTLVAGALPIAVVFPVARAAALGPMWRVALNAVGPGTAGALDLR